MAKKPQTPTNSEAQQRQSRKELLIARKRERQVRNLRIAGVVVLALIAIVIAIAVVNELFITPDRPVATVGDRTIALEEWQQRVTYERAQRIIFLENQLEAFGGDVGIVQQFGGSVINELLDPEGLGENVLNVMAEELVICDAVAERGIAISDADVQNEINVNFGFFGEGVSPTDTPEATQTIQPTPSLTPIPAAGSTDEAPTETPLPTPTTGPTATPFPTPTPLSQSAFDEQFGEIMTSVTDLGASEATYRNVVRAQMCRDRLADALAEEQSLSRVAPQASTFVIVADTEEAANEVQAQIEADGFLTAWNTIASRVDD
ncbi:MAG: SurA N-terminal domain-containing protein, partial [Candidatus Promineofilum sp.]|nr:SurA N-terminal domain-containing protein [Promineifilum sp.]